MRLLAFDLARPASHRIVAQSSPCGATGKMQRMPDPEEQVGTKLPGDKKFKKCMYGSRCTNKKCGFAHPAPSTGVEPLPVSREVLLEETTTAGSSQLKRTAPCRFGARCTAANC
eukprot:3380097-Rhodomonas_salina.1